MRRRARRWRFGLIGVGLIVILAAGSTASQLGARHFWSAEANGDEPRPTAPVKRADLWVTLAAGGTIQSANRTVIECELENLEAGVNGQRLYAGGASTILSVVPDGSMVKKSDVICRLDSSEYEEVLRQQEMTVERARSDKLQAELTLQVAQLAVHEFVDGTHLQTLKDYEGQIALARAEWERIRDRLAWVRNMAAKGYAAASQVSGEVVNEQRCAVTLKQARTNLDVYRKYSAPALRRALENDVIAARNLFEYQLARLSRHENRLRRLQRQVENCTIRAPHDGLVVYANDARHQVYIEPGLTVRQQQKLFFLPDLSQLQVETMLHESVVNQIHEGMRAKIQVEGFADRLLEGHVTSVAILPTRNFFSEVPYYIAMVRLDAPPLFLRPGMSAEVEIATARRNDVLTIPSDALTVENGHDVCYVASQDGIERREVKVGEATTERLEVTEGLAEGERVVIEPEQPEVAANDSIDAWPAIDHADQPDVSDTH